MARILICDPLQKRALEIMGEKHEVVNAPMIRRDDLLERIAGFDAIVVRARTVVDAQVISRGTRLKVIARAGVGTDNIDVTAATERGILVVNSPDPSISAVSELTFLLLLMVCRRAIQAHISLSQAGSRNHDLVGTEIGGKTLGIVGLGRIGTKVAALAKGFGLDLLAADPYASPGYAERFGAKLVGLDDLLKRSDFITLHLPLTDSTRRLIGPREFALMKPSAVLINTSRSEVVDGEALLEAIAGKRIAGAGLDVFDEGSVKDLSRFDNVVLTPHIGASTREAQSQIAELIAREVVDALDGRPTRNPVNMPYMDRKTLELLQPYLQLIRKMVRVLSLFVLSNPRRVALSLFGEAGELEESGFLLRNAVLGIMSSFHEVNVVNVMATAERMGIKTEIARSTARDSYLSSMELKVQTDDGICSVRGALVDSDKPRIVELMGYRLEFVPEGHMLITEHRDIPGMVGIVGTKLGSAGVNIATMQLARKRIGEEAMMVIQTDREVPRELTSRMRRIKGISRVEALGL